MKIVGTFRSYHFAPRTCGWEGLCGRCPAGERRQATYTLKDAAGRFHAFCDEHAAPHQPKKENL